MGSKSIAGDHGGDAADDHNPPPLAVRCHGVVATGRPLLAARGNRTGLPRLWGRGRYPKALCGRIGAFPQLMPSAMMGVQMWSVSC